MTDGARGWEDVGGGGSCSEVRASVAAQELNLNGSNPEVTVVTSDLYTGTPVLHSCACLWILSRSDSTPPGNGFKCRGNDLDLFLITMTDEPIERTGCSCPNTSD